MNSILKKILSIVFLFVLTIGIIVAQNEIIFQENFNDNSKNWDVGLDSNEFSEIKDGKYCIENRDSNNWHWFTTNSQTYNQSRTWEIKTSIFSKKKKNYQNIFGFVFGSDGDNFNTILFNSSDSSFCIMKNENGNWSYIYEWYNSNMINADTFNTYQILKNEKFLYISINDKEICHFGIPQHYGNGVGFIVYPNVNALVDYLIIRKNVIKANNNSSKLIFNKSDFKNIYNLAIKKSTKKEYIKANNLFNQCLKYDLKKSEIFTIKNEIAYNVYTYANDYKKAYELYINLFVDYFENFPKPIFLDSNQTQDFYYYFANSAYQLNKIKFAEDYYKLALKYCPKSNQLAYSGILHNLGNINLELHNYVESFKYYEQSVRIKEKITYKVTTEKYKQLCLGYRGLALNSFNMENNQYGFEYSKIWNSYSKILDDTANIIESYIYISRGGNTLKYDSLTINNAASFALGLAIPFNNEYYYQWAEANYIYTLARYNRCDSILIFLNNPDLYNNKTIRIYARSCILCDLNQKGIQLMEMLPDSILNNTEKANLGLLYLCKSDTKDYSQFFNKRIKDIITQLSVFYLMTNQEKESFESQIKNNRNIYYSLSELSINSKSTKELIDLLAIKRKNLISYTNQKQKSNSKKNNNDIKLLKGQLDSLNLKEVTNDLKIIKDKIEIDVNILQFKLSRNSDIINQTNIDSIKKTIKKTEIALDIRKYNYFNICNRTITDTIHYTLLVIAKDTTFSIYLKNGNQLEKQLSEYNKYSSGNLKYKKDTSSFQLFWAEIDKYLKGYDKVYICPDGVFSKINIESLYDKSQNQYVGDKYKIEIVRNLGDIVNRKDTIKSISNNETIVLMGGADYDNKPNFTYDSTSILAYNTTSLRDGVQGKLQYLPGTKKEVEVIGELLKKQGNKTVIYTGKSASEENVKAIKKPKIWHIATHGFFLENSIDSTKSYQEPLLKTGLYLSGANITRKGEKIGDDKDDGVFTAFEALNLDLTGTELVVLSACGTGKGDVKDGEGIYGLPRAIMEAGAESVLMSMWNVDDIGTMEYMKRFYTFRSKGLTNRESYQKTIQSLKNDPEFNYPYYWASFILIDR